MRALLLAALLLAGCATPPAPDPASPQAGWSGKLGYRSDASSTQRAQAGSALFELQGDARQGRLQLSSPLGSALAEAQWSPGAARLFDGRGWREHGSLDQLGEALGEALQGPPLPLRALFSWLMREPVPSEPWQPGADGSFVQWGWTVQWRSETQLRIERSRPDGGMLQLTLVIQP